MSPIPFVRGQAIVLATLLLACSLLGYPVAGLATAIGAALAAIALAVKYRSDVRATETPVPRHRARLDRVVERDAIAAIGAGLLTAAILTGVSLGDSATLRDIGRPTVPLVIAAFAVYASSLVDWFVVLPRISGQLGARPCRDEEPAFPFPHTWKEVTRWWYIHRILATVVFRFSLSAALVIVIGEIAGLGTEARWLAAGAMGVFSSYAAAIPKAVREAGQARVLVGQTVEVAPRRRRWPWRVLASPKVAAFTGRQYVFDVALEGVQLTPTASREDGEPPDPPEFVKHPDRIPLADLDFVKNAETPFHGCSPRCAGISWYCIENQRCFEPK
jgi:hypothetical protein